MTIKLKLYFGIFLSFLTLTSLTIPKTNLIIENKLNKTTFYIFPNKDDTTTYIKREFESKKYCIEKIYYNGELILQTSIYYSNDTTFSYDEFAFFRNELIESREHILTEYNTTKKNLFVKDSLTFVVNYYRNGNIASCGYQKSFCPCSNEYYFDKDNLTFETGFNSENIKYDTIPNLINGESQFIIKQKCGNPIGTWRKYDLYNKQIDSTKY